MSKKSNNIYIGQGSVGFQSNSTQTGNTNIAIGHLIKQQEDNALMKAERERAKINMRDSLYDPYANMIGVGPYKTIKDPRPTIKPDYVKPKPKKKERNPIWKTIFNMIRDF